MIPGSTDIVVDVPPVQSTYTAEMPDGQLRIGTGGLKEGMEASIFLKQTQDGIFTNRSASVPASVAICASCASCSRVRCTSIAFRVRENPLCGNGVQRIGILRPNCETRKPAVFGPSPPCFRFYRFWNNAGISVLSSSAFPRVESLESTPGLNRSPFASSVLGRSGKPVGP